VKNEAKATETGEVSQGREADATGVTLVCVMDGCSKPARPSSRFCSVEHNMAAAYRGGARW